MTLQPHLFDSPAEEYVESTIFEGSLPPGLILIPSFVSKAEERELIAFFDDPHRSQWTNDLSRRVQQYGYRYNYKSRAVTASDKIGSIPSQVQRLGDRLVDLEYFSSPPDQVIVNEYEPGQGISAHIDRETCFGDTVASLSLGSDIVMQFRAGEDDAGALVLPARSLVVLAGEARYRWTHSIVGRKRDHIASHAFVRGRRLSLTFRTVLLQSGA